MWKMLYVRNLLRVGSLVWFVFSHISSTLFILQDYPQRMSTWTTGNNNNKIADFKESLSTT